MEDPWKQKIFPLQKLELAYKKMEVTFTDSSANQFHSAAKWKQTQNAKMRLHEILLAEIPNLWISDS